MRRTIAEQLKIQELKIKMWNTGVIKDPRPVDPIPKNFNQRILNRYPDMQMWQCSICKAECVCKHREPELLRHFIGLDFTDQLELINRIDAGWS